MNVFTYHAIQLTLHVKQNVFRNGQTNNYSIKYFRKFGFALTFSRKFLHYICYINAKSKTINFNVLKAKYKINNVYLIKVKYKLLVAANLRLQRLL